MLAPNELGYYSVPKNLSMQVQKLINPVITRVGFPLIAKVQSEISQVSKIYLKSINMTASANAPVYVFVAYYSDEIVGILLGSAWSESSQLLVILAIWAGVRSLSNPVGILLLGMGRVLGEALSAHELKSLLIPTSY